MIMPTLIFTKKNKKRCKECFIIWEKAKPILKQTYKDKSNNKLMGHRNINNV